MMKPYKIKKNLELLNAPGTKQLIVNLLKYHDSHAGRTDTTKYYEGLLAEYEYELRCMLPVDVPAVVNRDLEDEIAERLKEKENG